MKSLFRKKLVQFLVVAVVLLAGCGAASAAQRQILLARVKSIGASTAKITWKRVSGASRYVVVYENCGNDFTSRSSRIKVSGKKSSCKLKKLNPKKSYKFYVMAQKKKGSGYMVIAKSEIGHFVSRVNGSVTNPAGINAGTKSMKIAAGSSVALKATVTKADSEKKWPAAHHGSMIRYTSSNKMVATVSESGMVKAVKKGTCYIYAIAINGDWSAVKVTVTQPKTKVKTTVKTKVKTKVKTEVKTVTEKASSYTLTYQYLGDVPSAAPAVPASRTVKVGDAVTAAAVPTAAGYTFSGWKGEVTSMPERNVTVTGSWSANTHTLTYKYTGEVPENAPKAPVRTVRYGEKVAAADEPAAQGYTFSGWKGEVSVMPDNDVTVTGSWSAKAYTVTYQFAGDIPSGASVPAAQKVTYRGKVETPDVSAPEGYEFKGWKGMVSTMPAHDITVTGVWSRKEYTLSYAYRKYGGNYKMPEDFAFPAAPKSVKVKYGDVLPLSAVPSCEGFRFDEAWTLEDGKAVPEKMPAHDLTVYGSWHKEYTIRYLLYSGYKNNYTNHLLGRKTATYAENEDVPIAQLFDFDKEETLLIEENRFEEALKNQEARYLTGGFDGIDRSEAVTWGNILVWAAKSLDERGFWKIYSDDYNEEMSEPVVSEGTEDGTCRILNDFEMIGTLFTLQPQE